VRCCALSFRSRLLPLTLIVLLLLHSAPCRVRVRAAWGLCADPKTLSTFKCGAGMQSRQFKVTKLAQAGGACLNQGKLDTRRCDAPKKCKADCVGSWRNLSGCSPTRGVGAKFSTFVVSQSRVEGGAACAVADGTKNAVACANAKKCCAFAGHKCVGTAADLVAALNATRYNRYMRIHSVC